MKMRISLYRIEDGYKIPRGFGVAYYDHVRAYVICYPLLFNLLVNIARKIYWRLVQPSLPEMDNLLYKAHRKGVLKGYKAHQALMEQVFEDWKRERSETDKNG